MKACKQRRLCRSQTQVLQRQSSSSCQSSRRAASALEIELRHIIQQWGTTTLLSCSCSSSSCSSFKSQDRTSAIHDQRSTAAFTTVATVPASTETGSFLPEWHLIQKLRHVLTNHVCDDNNNNEDDDEQQQVDVLLQSIHGWLVLQLSRLLSFPTTTTTPGLQADDPESAAMDRRCQIISALDSLLACLYLLYSSFTHKGRLVQSWIPSTTMIQREHSSNRRSSSGSGSGSCDQLECEEVVAVMLRAVHWLVHKKQLDGASPYGGGGGASTGVVDKDDNSSDTCWNDVHHTSDRAVTSTFPQPEHHHNLDQSIYWALSILVCLLPFWSEAEAAMSEATGMTQPARKATTMSSLWRNVFLDLVTLVAVDISGSESSLYWSLKSRENENDRMFGERQLPAVKLIVVVTQFLKQAVEHWSNENHHKGRIASNEADMAKAAKTALSVILHHQAEQTLNEGDNACCQSTYEQILNDDDNACCQSTICGQKLFAVQCRLRMMRGRPQHQRVLQEESDGGLERLLTPFTVHDLQRIALKPMKSKQLALQATDCLSLVSEAGYWHVKHHSITNALLAILTETKLDIKRESLPGLLACFTNRKIDLSVTLCTDENSKELKRIIASLVEVVLRPKAPHFPFEPSREVVAAKVLSLIFTPLLSRYRKPTFYPCPYGIIPLSDLMNILLVLLDSENDQVVQVITMSLCRELRLSGGVDLLQETPELLSSFAGVMARLGGEKKGGVTRTILSTIYELVVSSSDQLIATMLTRQPLVLQALVQIAGSSKLDMECKGTAVCILLLASHDAGNRRILAKQSGLLPCLIGYTRRASPGSDEHPEGLTTIFAEQKRALLRREVVKECIVQLATAL